MLPKVWKQITDERTNERTKQVSLGWEIVHRSRFSSASDYFVRNKKTGLLPQIYDIRVQWSLKNFKIYFEAPEDIEFQLILFQAKVQHTRFLAKRYRHDEKNQNIPQHEYEHCMKKKSNAIVNFHSLVGNLSNIARLIDKKQV